MQEIYKDYLFEKHILVHEAENEETNIFETLFALAHYFGVKITKGWEFVHHDMIDELSIRFGKYIPAPFYKGFPDSVRALSTEELLFDQLMHYFETYGLHDFDTPGHSVFEKDFSRAAFQENVTIREFTIQTEEEAEKTLQDSVKNLLSGTRPLSKRQYDLAIAFLLEHDDDIPEIASINTLVRVLIDTKNLSLVDRLHLSDVMKVVDELNYRNSRNANLKKLNLKNQDRKLLAAILDRMFMGNRCDISTCYEKKQLWNGFLHHIHYQPKNAAAEMFLCAMRQKGNESAYSEFEKLMRENRVLEAAEFLKKKKGTSAVLRNMDYILSRVEQKDEQVFFSKFLQDVKCSPLILLQLLLKYKAGRREEQRVFRFTRHNLLKVHFETCGERERRRSKLTEEQTKAIGEMISSKLSETLKNRFGKVYIAPSMKCYALPISEDASQGGFGVLSRGSRIPIGEGKKLRAFTYWEKADDIDLSVFALTEDGERKEFSWRTMSEEQSEAITFSGDETSGYYGGSEFFDINLPKFKEQHPEYRYLIFCDNVFRGDCFNRCFCKAGYMFRDEEDSGEIYEPKTVKSAFLVNCEGTFAYLFGIDLCTNEFIWLNMARDSGVRVAGRTSVLFLMEYFHVTEIINLFEFFSMMAEEVVEDSLEADVVVTDHETKCAEGAMVIREYDHEKIRALME